MLIVDVELPRFLLVRPTWCHSAAKSRWRAQAPSQRSLSDTARLLPRTKAKIRKGHRILRRFSRAGKSRGRDAKVRPAWGRHPVGHQAESHTKCQTRDGKYFPKRVKLHDQPF